MKKLLLRLLIITLAVLLVLTACSPAVPPVETDEVTTETDKETYIRDTYEDLSHNGPSIQINNKRTVTVTSDGMYCAQDYVLDFTKIGRAHV